LHLEADPRQEFDQSFQIERHRSEEGLHRKLHFARIATTSQPMPLLGFAKLNAKNEARSRRMLQLQKISHNWLPG